MIVSYFSARFLTEDNRVSCGVMGRSVPVRCLKRIGCPSEHILLYVHRSEMAYWGRLRSFYTPVASSHVLGSLERRSYFVRFYGG